MPQEVTDLLKPLKMPDNVKADAWDAFYDSADENDLAQRLQKIAIPQETKAQLWDMKMSRRTAAPAPLPRPGAPAQPAEAAPTMGQKLYNWVMSTASKEGPAMAGGALGGALGAPLGPPGIATGAVFGGAGGEALRQLYNRATGQPAPQTSGEAADLLSQGAMTGIGQEAGAFAGNRGAEVAARYGTQRAQRLTEQILNPTKEQNKVVTERILPELADQRLMALTRAGYATKIQNAMNAASQKLDSAWAELPADASLKTGPILQALRAAKKEFVVEGQAIEPKAVEHIDSLMDTLRQFGDDVSPQSLRKVRQIWDRTVSRAGGFKGKELNEASALFARKEGANAIRNELAKRFPDIAKINAEFSFWSKADEVIQDTLTRNTGQMRKTAEVLAGIGGAAGGFAKGGVNEAVMAAGAMSGLAALMKSTAWKSVSAATQGKIAEALMNKNFKAAAALVGMASGGMLSTRALNALSAEQSR